MSSAKNCIPNFNEYQKGINTQDEIECKPINDKISCVYNSQSATSKTILITNNYSKFHQPNTSKNNKLNNSSITIYTHKSDSETTVHKPASSGSPLVLDRINILINNHFNETPATADRKTPPIQDDMNGKSVKCSVLTHDASSTVTTVLKEFVLGEDVLVKHTDDRYYLGTIVTIGSTECLVKFGDNTELWSSISELVKLNFNENETTCILCKKEEENQKIEICRKCQRGYHASCLKRRQEINGSWHCKRCLNLSSYKWKLGKNSKPIKTEPLTQYPYDVHSSNWNKQQQHNKQQVYSYCGKDDDWYMEMVQCTQCLQWFHKSCLNCLHCPIFCGENQQENCNGQFEDQQFTDVRCSKSDSESISTDDSQDDSENETIANGLRKDFSKNKIDKNSSLPPTPPTSISRPPSPTLVNGANENDVFVDSDRSRDIYDFERRKKSENRKLMKRKLKSHSIKENKRKKEFVDQYESSDDTSSRSTLDLIIPPPKNFQGFNNPFLSPTKVDNNIKKNQIDNKNTNGNTLGTLSLFGKSCTSTRGSVRIVRTVKRRLSAKDIMIGPNMEVKKKKLRRRLSANVEVIRTATIHSSTSKFGSHFPMPNNEVRSINSIEKSNEYSSGRKLRKRESPEDDGTNKCEVSMSDLQTSLTEYFGAINRIQSGEEFIVRGKRIGLKGRFEYLIEWGEKS